MESDPLLPLLESVNGGKGVRIAREADLADSVACLRYYAGLADKPNGESGVVFFYFGGGEGVRGVGVRVVWGCGLGGVVRTWSQHTMPHYATPHLIEFRHRKPSSNDLIRA